MFRVKNQPKISNKNTQYYLQSINIINYQEMAYNYLL